MVEYGGGLVEKILQIGLQMQWPTLNLSIFFIKEIHIYMILQTELLSLKSDGRGAG